MTDRKNNRTALFPVGSVTYAQKGQRILAEKGIKSTVEHSESSSGCAYSLRVSESDYPFASSVLARNGIFRRR